MLVRKHINTDSDPEKQAALLVIQRNERYWQGNHYNYPQMRNNSVQWNSTTGNMLSPAQNPKQRMFDYVFNFYYGDGLKLVGVLGKVPNAKAQARDSDNDNAVAHAAKADKIIKELWSHWDVEQQQSELVFSLYKTSTTFGYTPYVTNAEKYGTTTIPIMEMRDTVVGGDEYNCFNCGATSPKNIVDTLGSHCPECQYPLGPESYVEPQIEQIPQVADTKTFENGSVEFELANQYTVTTPFKIKGLRGAPWLKYEYYEHPGMLIATYSELRNEETRRKVENEGPLYNNASGENARIASDIAASPMRDGGRVAIHKEWRYTRLWLTPAMYYMIDNDQNGMIAAEIAAEYPTGLKLTAVNGWIIRAEKERLTEVWSMCKPTVGEYAYPQALGNPMIRANDMFNDDMNMSSALRQRQMPITFIDVGPGGLDMEAMNRNASVGAEFIPVLPGVGQKMRDMMYTPDLPKFDGQQTQLGEMAIMKGREVIGITAPLTGLATNTPTLGQAELNRNQALLPFNTTWNQIRRFWSTAYMNAILQYAKHSDGKMFFTNAFTDVAPPKQVEIENLNELMEGDFYVECEESIPMTAGQRRAQFWQLLQLAPEDKQMIGLGNPENLQAIHDALGNSDIQIPGMEARLKVLEEIKQLLSAAPIQQQDPMTGQVIMSSSIPPDQFEDDHGFVVQVIKDWAQTENARNIRQSNPNGYANVIQFGLAHQAIIDQQNMAAQQAPAGGPPPSGGPVPPPQPPPMGDMGTPAPGVSNLQNMPQQPPFQQGPEEMQQPVTQGI